jgi:isoleucyl-tRNA synthetase
MKQKKHHSFFGDALSLPELEEKVLKFWQDNKIFEKSIEQRRRAKPFVFYEGPPTANGRPGIHHVLARSFKDIVLRYRAMRGFFTPRRGGWDTHGLPVELQAEKQLGLSSKRDIERYGIAEFNKKCRESVWEYKDEWEKLTRRIGFWLDLDDPYITYENEYIETLWHIIKQFSLKKLLYKGHKVVPWCTRCGTSLSSHELGQPGAYKTVKDTSVFVKFRLTPQSAKRLGQIVPTLRDTQLPVYVLSWTTTPWTLPGNVALAVGEGIDYALVRYKGERFIVAKSLVAKVFGEGVEIEGNFKGGRLIDLEYEPLFDIPKLKNRESHKVYGAGFVTTDEGTGVVHTAVMYGEDDYQLGMKVGLPQRHTVDEQGNFTRDVPDDLANLYVKSEEAERRILDHLTRTGTLLKEEKYEHEYPHCWRCDTPLLYYARTSWFVKMSALRKKLLGNNKTINWFPRHLKEGRFGEWLKEAKDWNFSRSRYWGTPLPVWECGKCGRQEVIGNIAELGKRAKLPNEFLLLRHGEATHNVKNLCGPHEDEPFVSRLTAKGRVQAQKVAARLAKAKIDLIVSSPLERARETASIVAGATGAPLEYDTKLIDRDPGVFAGKTVREFEKFYKHTGRGLDWFERVPDGAETFAQVRARMWAVIERLNKVHHGKKILIVSHGDPLWILKGVLENLPHGPLLKAAYPEKGALYQVAPLALPRDEEGNLDLHRPYVDGVKFSCNSCRGAMRRVEEVADVWYDSGAMPFAQAHWPFAQGGKAIHHFAYPADYICEAVDQTRGWFYTLLAVATALGKKAPYRNVICLGLIHDKYGQKMSKSKGNVVDPWEMAGRYGIDAVRWYFYTGSPTGEPKNFDEDEIAKSFRKFHMLAYNSFMFWKTYAGKGERGKGKGLTRKHILDRWILSRLNDVSQRATVHLDRFEIREAALALEGLVDDLSRWYIRRSRRRFQPQRAGGSASEKQKAVKDFKAASATLATVLFEISKMTAPFTPFFAEALYQAAAPAVAGNRKKLSVHLEDWVSARGTFDKRLVADMEKVRSFAAAGLAKRAEAGIKVRQPLKELRIKNKELSRELLEILKDEVNVKEVAADAKLKGDVALDTAVTPELREEGVVRELVRMVQDLRQKADCKPSEKVSVWLSVPQELSDIVKRHEALLKREVNAKAVSYLPAGQADAKSGKTRAHLESKLGEWEVWVGVKKGQ